MREPIKKDKRFRTHPVRTNKRRKISILSKAHPGKTISTSIHFSKAMLYPDLLETRDQQPAIIQHRGDDIINI